MALKNPKQSLAVSVCVCVYLCWTYRAALPEKRRPACRPGFPRWTSEQQSQRLGSRWEGTTDLWSAQRSFRGTCGWTDLQRDKRDNINQTGLISSSMYNKHNNNIWGLTGALTNFNTLQIKFKQPAQNPYYTYHIIGWKRTKKIRTGNVKKLKTFKILKNKYSNRPLVQRILMTASKPIFLVKYLFRSFWKHSTCAGLCWWW